MHLTNEIFLHALETLGLDEMTQDDQVALIATYSGTLLENVMLRFLQNQSEWEQESFSEWMKIHGTQTDILEQLITLYPLFADLLVEEILLLQTNLVNTPMSA